MVPNGWNLKHLSELSNKISDGIHSTPKYDESSDIYFVNGNNLKNGSIVITDSTKKVCIDDAEKHRRELNEKTILMSINGTIGNLAYYKGENVVLGKSACYINVADGTDIDYVYYTLEDSKTQAFYTSELTGSTIKNLSLKTIKATKILTPPLPEQRKIAKILSTWDKAISTTERLIDNSKQQKKALIQQLLTGKKRLLDDSGKQFEGEWEEVKLGEISHITTGSSNREDSSLDGEYTFFDRSEDIRTSSRYLFDSEAVIVPGEGQDFVPKHFEGKFDLHQRTYAIMNFDGCVGRFLFYYIGYHRHYFLAQAVGSTVKSLRLPMFQKMPIYLPNQLEQAKIASVLNNADREIKILQQQLADLKQEKKALMQQLLTGKRRVKIDEKEVA